jgi:hypothetical protein
MAVHPITIKQSDDTSYLVTDCPLLGRGHRRRACSQQAPLGGYSPGYGSLAAQVDTRDGCNTCYRASVHVLFQFLLREVRDDDDEKLSNPVVRA